MRLGETVVAIGVLGTLACGCSSDSGKVSTRASIVGPPVTVSGALTYDRVPATVSGLDFAATRAEPIRGAVVQLLRYDGLVLDETTSADDGSYLLTTTFNGQVRVRVRAQTVTPPMVVEDPNTGDAIYSIQSPLLQPSDVPTQDLHAASGWDGSAYSGARDAAPFAILDTCLTAARAFTAVRSVALTPLKINWPNERTPVTSYYGEGQSYGGTQRELYILGGANSDTDEFDASVVVHEWGHYYQATVARDDSIAGDHDGSPADPRVAFSEGFANALSGIVLGQPRYLDTSGANHASVREIPLETQDAFKGNHGWFSEHSVGFIVYDAFDADADAGDAVALGLGPVHDALSGPLAQSEAFTTVFSFLNGLKATQPGAATEVDALTARELITPVADAFGTGETHDGPRGMDLPVYDDLTVGGSVTRRLRSRSGSAHNLLEERRYLRVIGDGTSLVLTTTCPVDVDLRVFSFGQELARTTGLTGNERLAFPTQVGLTYVVELRSWNKTDLDFSCTVSLSR